MTGIDESSGPASQEVRLAVTMVGGVSLAVWMGGVAREISHVVQASRRRNGLNGLTGPDGTDGPSAPEVNGGKGSAPDRDQAEAVRTCYEVLLELLQVSVSVDVLTGTSAGGINAACLGAAEGYRSTLSDLRDVWLETGSFSKLLRDPEETQPRSVLYGDKVMLNELNQALTQIAAGGRGAPNPDITVILTSTMVDGETTRFTDALGSRIRDTEHRLLFRFDGDHWKQGQSQAALALAARSTASFPAAFELSRLPVGDESQVDDLHPDSSLYTNAVSSHWLTDGGVLLNKPLAPALRAIFQRPAGDDIRRLMLYVAPTGEEEVEKLPVDKANPPLLGKALTRVLGAVTSQTISAELEDLDRHNEAVTRTRGTRVSLARMGTRLGTGLVDEGLLADYRRRRVQSDAAELVQEAMRRLSQKLPTMWAAGTDELLINSAGAMLMQHIPSHLPSAEPGEEGKNNEPGEAGENGENAGGFDYDELGRFRTSALEAAVGTGLQLVGMGFRLDPSKEQAAVLNKARQSLHTSRHHATRTVSVSTWVEERLKESPTVLDHLVTSKDLAGWVGQLAQGWATAGPDTSEVAEQWRQVAQTLQEAAPTMRELSRDRPPTIRLSADLASAWTDDQQSIDSLTDYLLPEKASVERICGRLLALHVAERGLLAVPPSVDQRVDLVQVGADTRSLLDPTRDTSMTKLTGIQVHNFGAFYKRSWRANDWMWGRVDGAGWLVHALLDPRRLRLLRDMTPDAPDGTSGRDVFARQVAQTFRRLGWVCTADADSREGDAVRRLLQDVEPLRESLDQELAFLGLDGDLQPIDEQTAGLRGALDSLPVSLPTTALVLARGIQSIIAADELPVVANAAAGDAAAGGSAGAAKGFIAQFPRPGAPEHPAAGDAARAAAIAPVALFDTDTPPSKEAMLRVQGLFRSCKISQERFQTEQGSKLLARTLVQTAAVTVNAASAAGNVPTQVGAAFKFARSATRSAWWVTQGANSLPRPWNVVAGAVTALAGVVLAGADNVVLQAIGVASLVGGLIFLLVSLPSWRMTWRWIAITLGVSAVCLFLFAGFIPWMRSWWFDWLGGLTDTWRTGQLPGVWLAVAAFILLPAFAQLFSILTRPVRRRRRGARPDTRAT
jgi:patatin-related protein